MALKICKECGTEVSKSAKICPKCGKKLKHSWLRIILGILIVCIGLVGIISDSDDISTTINSDFQSNNQSQEKFTLISSEMTTDIIGSCYIEGTIQNNTSKTYNYVQVTFNIYDIDGNQLGTAVDNINNFQANATYYFI